MSSNEVESTVVLIEDEVAGSAMVDRIRDRLPAATFKVVDREEISRLRPDEDRCPALLVAKQRGRFLKLCPGYQGSNCCAYFILHTINGCRFGCTYCALGAVINSPFITIYANVDDLEAELDRKVFNASSRIHRVGTGQFSDSMDLDSIAGISPFLVELFGRNQRSFLELKSKSRAVEHLLDLDHRNRTIVSFSLSLPEVIEREEGGTATLEERLDAAHRAQETGYRIGLHFDPLVEVEDWRNKYADVVEMIGDMLDPEGVVWVSLGTLRLDKSLRYSMRDRNPSTRLDLAELTPGYDGRFRYLPDLRGKMYEALAKFLARLELPVYLCMEAPRFWKRALGWSPQGPLDVKELLDDWALNRWPKGR